MTLFTIKNYKVNSENAVMTAPNGTKYNLGEHGIPVYHHQAKKCYLCIGDEASVKGYRLPVPENLELVGEYLDKFNESVAKWKSENQKWFSKKYQFSRKVRTQKVPTQFDHVETNDVSLWFHPLWVQWDNRESRDGTWWDYNVAKGLESPTNDFMDAAIASDLRYYQRLQWINDPSIRKASLVEAKKIFKADIAPLIEKLIVKIESGELASEQTAKESCKNILDETIEYAKEALKDVPNTMVYPLKNPFKKVTVVVVKISGAVDESHHFEPGDLEGIKSLANAKSVKPIKRVK